MTTTIWSGGNGGQAARTQFLDQHQEHNVSIPSTVPRRRPSSRSIATNKFVFRQDAKAVSSMGC